MPELPEVETVRRRLRPALLGAVVRRADLLWERTLATPTPGEFLARLPGQTIHEVGRRGKHLILYLDQGALLVHLRMSGDLYLEDEAAEIAPHHRLLLYLQDGRRLAFNDTRKFGRVWLAASPDEIVGGLGPEPLDPDFIAADLYARLRATRRQLKPLLLDQTFLAGLGNIYTDEALHLARLHPLRAANTLRAEEADQLWTAIRAVLEEGIRRNGASIDWVYRGGEFQNYFRAYQRTGQPCPVCGTPIVRLVVGQRSTHICPNCQK